MLRQYQEDIINAARQSLKQHRSILVVAPTGAGKTHIAAQIIRSTQDNGKRTLFLAPRRELIYQSHERFTQFGIHSGIIMAGEAPSLYAKSQVASFDTLHARAVQRNKIEMPEADLVVVDEAHLSISPKKAAILKHYQDKGAIVIGLTATPARGDGGGLGDYYHDIVMPVTPADLMDQGFLIRPRYFAPTTFDLKDVRVNKEDYIINELIKAVDKPKLIGDIYENWQRIAGDKRTVIFCTSRKHSRHIRDYFLSNGVQAEHVDGETPTDERADIFRRVRSGETQVLCNVFVASYGLDIPQLECAVIARPTKNITLWLQTIGRVLRTASGKDEAIIIDHTGALKEHGFADDHVPWSLEGSDVRKRKEKKEKEDSEPKKITCEKCHTVFFGTRECPECGHQVIPPTEKIPVKEADLEEVSKSKANENRMRSAEYKRKFFGMLKYHAQQQGYSPHWASHKYREKFGVWPNAYKDSPMVKPDEEMRNWIKYQQIKFAKKRVG